MGYCVQNKQGQISSVCNICGNNIHGTHLSLAELNVCGDNIVTHLPSKSYCKVEIPKTPKTEFLPLNDNTHVTNQKHMFIPNGVRI